MRTTIPISIIVTAAIGLIGCDKSPTEPSLQHGAASVLSSVSITSMPAGSAIGQTVQLTATAVYSDKATKDVTSEAVWTSLDPAVATVSSTGVVTVLQFGACNITAQFQSLSTTRQFSARLPTSGFLPFHLSGVATDDEGQPLVGARILLNYAFSAAALRPWTETTTDAQGRYEADFEARLGGYFRASTAQVSVVSDGHERDDRWFRPINNDPNQTVDLHPRVIRWIRVDEPVSVTVADDGAPCINNVRDMPNYSIHWVCRKVRLVVPADGILTVTAVPRHAGGVQPDLTMEGPGELDCCFLGNPLDMPVKAGMVVKISVEILEGVPSQTFTLTATIR
jgi:hypothetical protein